MKINFIRIFYLVLSLLFSFGFFGFDNDVLISYVDNELSLTNLSKYREPLGWFLSSLGDFEILSIKFNISIFLISVYLYRSIRSLARSVSKSAYFKKTYFNIDIIAFILYISPFLISFQNNVLRQGFSTVFIYYTISSLFSRKYKSASAYSIMAFFSHNSAIFILFPLFISYFIKIAYSSFIKIFLFVILLAGLLLSKYFFGESHAEHHTGFDFRLPFLLISICCIAFIRFFRGFVEQYFRENFLFAVVMIALFISFSLSSEIMYERLFFAVSTMYFLIFSSSLSVVSRKMYSYVILFSFAILIVIFNFYYSNSKVG